MEYVRVSFVLVFVLVGFTAAGSSRRLLLWAVDDSGCRTPNKGVGVCLRISECKPMIDFLATKQEYTKKEISALASYQCGIFGNEPKVCCPSEPLTLEWAYDDDGCRTPDKGVGTCVSIQECKLIYTFIQQSESLTDEVRDALRKYACGFDSRGTIKVCCPDSVPAIFSRNVEDHSKHPNAKLLPENCGMSSLNRITNGNVTDLFEYPWAVVLKYQKNINPYSCGGSLINDRYILTAAHCIKSRNKLIAVRLGEHDFSTEFDCIENGNDKSCAPPPQDFDISADDAIVHPDYNADTLLNDIALIRLRTKANTTVDSVLPICLPITAPEKSRKFGNYTVIGWGATETGYSSPVLLKVLVPKVENAKCAPLYASRTTLTDKQLCAGGKKEQDSCAGDSGGPLSGEFVDDGTLRTIQYGIVSFGPRICGVQDFPAVYTRVDKYMGWIINTIRP